MSRQADASRRRGAAMGFSTAVLALLVAGCAPGTGDPPSSGPATTASLGPTSSPSPTGHSGALTVSDRDDGHTLDAAVGEVVVASLASTYWRFEPPPPGAVLLGDPLVTPAARGTCLPGVGCGTVVARYRLEVAATITLRAGRTTCGEALACSPDQSAWVVHLRVR